jgi:ribonuclease PH
MTDYKRNDGRGPFDLRPVRVTTQYTKWAEGSILIEMGNTRVLCTASIEDRVPPFLKGKGVGWITSEYGMLPRATETRTQRETRNGPSGRTQEIQRLIGRSLRSIIDMSALGERQIMIDCDVLQADGGTRTAAITGGFVALALAVNRWMENAKILRPPIRDYIAASSVGVISGRVLLDLDYSEDSKAEVDMNVVCTGDGRFVEVQGTAETEAFDRDRMDEMLDAAQDGIAQLIDIQKQVLAKALGSETFRALMDPAQRGKINWKEKAQ